MMDRSWVVVSTFGLGEVVTVEVFAAAIVVVNGNWYGTRPSGRSSVVGFGGRFCG